MGADTQSLVESLHTDLCYVPAGCTGIAQPMNVSINAPFKKNFQEKWIKWRWTPEARKPDGRMTVPTRQLVINWVSIAWESISAETVAKSFLTCGISNALDGSEYHLIREEIPKDIDDDEEDGIFADPDEDVDELDPFTDSEN